uniref:Uncharacterized protein n=1 Tax=Angiostrongylus costaricensis TaxID=334426 RepID=A0A0R3PTX7_ANGCS
MSGFNKFESSDHLNTPNNPHPGKLFNRQHGPEISRGLKIDYKVKANFQSCESGDRMINSKTSISNKKWYLLIAEFYPCRVNRLWPQIS